MRRKRLAAVSAAAVVGLTVAALWAAFVVPPAEIPRGWGVDACLSVHVPASRVERLLGRLGKARLRYVRERVPGGGNADAQREVFRTLKRRGYRIVAFAGSDRSLAVERREQLPRDLLEVYHSARRYSQEWEALVDVWEMVGEPDTNFCHDLPERVAAFQKAVYLGLKDGARGRRKPTVLMGALGHFPGPWLDRAKVNGLLDYTDALNFHYYGQAADLRGVIRAQRRFANEAGKDALPLWITECGLNAVADGDFANPERREWQRRFAVETAEIARAERVAVFMPFIFVHKGDGYAMVEPNGRAYPAWDAYADYTRENVLDAGSAVAPPRAPARLVLQWLPDNRTCLPQKVSGAYWFRGGAAAAKPIEGEIVAYNFSGRPISGVLEIETPTSIALESGTRPGTRQPIEVRPFSKTRVPVRFVRTAPGYVRGAVRARFVGGRSAAHDSSLTFEVASQPRPAVLKSVGSLALSRPGEAFQWIWAPGPFERTSEAGPWVGVNGVRVLPPDSEAPDAWRFEIPESSNDPTRPTMAVASVAGLPPLENGFLRLRLFGEDTVAVDVRVDLIDSRGQRFAIAENFGRNWMRPEADTIYLSFEDFGIYQWGRCTERPTFDPAEVREVQLRFFAPLGGRIGAQLDLMAPR
jgi:hypothetical protein